MRRRKDTRKTITSLETLFKCHPNKWLSINYLSKELWKEGRAEGWYPFRRIGRLLRSEFHKKGLAEISKNGRWWKSRLHEPIKSHKIE